MKIYRYLNEHSITSNLNIFFQYEPEYYLLNKYVEIKQFSKVDIKQKL